MIEGHFVGKDSHNSLLPNHFRIVDECIFMFYVICQNCLKAGTLISSFMNHAHLVYRQVSNIRRTLVGNKIVDHSDVVGAPPVGATPTTSSFST